MHAIAKMVRILSDKTERPIEACFPGAVSPMAEVTEGEEVRVKLWHGACLEAEAIIQCVDGKAVVRLLEKKILSASAPKEAL